MHPLDLYAEEGDAEEGDVVEILHFTTDGKSGKRELCLDKQGWMLPGRCIMS